MKLELSEGRVYGARYHTVRPRYEYYSGTVPTGWQEMVEWCVATFGPTPEDGVHTPNSRWYINHSKFWFRNEQDMTVFVLRWR